MSPWISVCLAAFGLLTHGAYAVSAEDAAPADGAKAVSVAPAADAAASTPPAADPPNTSSPPPGGEATTPAGGEDTQIAPPPDSPAPSGGDADAVSASRVAVPAPLPGGLTPVPLPEGVSTESVPPGAVPIKVEKGKITFAVIGKKPKNGARGVDGSDFDDEIMKTSLFEKFIAIFHHLRIRAKRFLKNRWNAAKGVAVTGSRALGDTVDTTKTYLSVGFTLVANLLRRLADFVERLPPPGLSSLTAFLLSMPMFPLNVGKAIVQEAFSG